MTRPTERGPDEIQEHDQLVNAHLATAADLVGAALGRAVREFPDAESGLRRSLQLGDMVRLSTTFAPAVGEVLLEVDLLPLSGEARTLMSCRLQREVVQ